MAKATTRTRFGPVTSEGTRQLWLVMKERGWGQTQLADSLELRVDRVNRLLYGDRRPGLELALKIHRTLGIDPELWHQPPLEPIVPFTLASGGADEAAAPGTA